MGRHKVDYIIERLPLLNGIYQIEVGIFSKNSLVCIDYKGEIKGFTVGNDYIAEGTFYIDHRWEIKQSINQYFKSYLQDKKVETKLEI